jgi:dolichyl-diphosphooligosaccharide--protein glycosyltransferase
VVGTFGFLYATHSFGVFPATSTSTNSSSSSSCSPATTTTSSTGTNGTYALICTNLGLIELQLFPASAPKTVANFVSLANSGFYNGLIWHRIVPGFVIQTGDPNTKNGGGNRSTWGSGTSGTSVPFEDDPSLHNTAGTIAMASTGAAVGGSSQFYINLADNSASLDGNYAVFGKVINGMSIVTALGNVPTNTTTQQPTTPSSATVVSVTIQSTP